MFEVLVMVDVFLFYKCRFFEFFVGRMLVIDGGVFWDKNEILYINVNLISDLIIKDILF